MFNEGSYWIFLIDLWTKQLHMIIVQIFTFYKIQNCLEYKEIQAAVGFLGAYEKEDKI